MSLRQFRPTKCSFFIHSISPYIHLRLDSRIQPKLPIAPLCREAEGGEEKQFGTGLFCLHLFYCQGYLQGCHGQGKSSGKSKIFQVREKSGNFIFSQGNLEKMKKSHRKVREFKKLLVNWLLVFHKLQAILEKECFLT